MSATIAAVLKKLAVYILTDKKALKIAVGIILGVIIIIIMPIVAVVSFFNGDINIDTDRLQTMVVRNLSAEEKAKLQFVEDIMNTIDDKMTAAGFNGSVKEAQVLYVLALPDFSNNPGFVDKLVSCFAENQTDEQLISAVNSAFGTQLTAEDFSNVMGNIRSLHIDTSDYTDISTKNNIDLVKWAIHAQEADGVMYTGLTAQCLINLSLSLRKISIPMRSEVMLISSVRTGSADEPLTVLDL